MKAIKSIFVGLLAAVIAISCTKEDTKVTFLGGTAPVLTVSDTTTLVLLQANAAYSSLQFQWTDPNFQFSNGVNTQDVYYTLQIDTLGSNFTNPNMATLPFTAVVNNTFTVKGFDDALGQLQLLDGVFHHFQFRIMATMASNGAAVEGGVPVFSNVVTIRIKTYLDVVYPVPANLYITGSATPGGWGPSGAPLAASSLPAQQFTKINAYTFQLKVALTGGNEFLFVPDYTSWNNKYGTTGANDTNNVSGDAFVPQGNNFLGPAASGTYTITVNFKTGKYSIQ